MAVFAKKAAAIKPAPTVKRNILKISIRIKYLGIERSSRLTQYALSVRLILAKTMYITD
jgi:hypothetical protein